MFNEQVFNAIKEPDQILGQTFITLWNQVLHDGITAISTIEYLEGRSGSYEKEQISHDEWVFFNFREGTKGIIIRGTVYANDRVDLLGKIETLKKNLLSKWEQKLIVKEGSYERSYDVVVKSLDLDENSYNRDWMAFEVEMETYGYAEDPRERIIEYSLSPWSLSIPIERGGTAPAYIRIVFTAIGDGDLLKITINWIEMQINQTIAAGTMIEIDGKKKQVKINGEQVGFSGIIGRLEEEQNSIEIESQMSGMIQIFYSLSYL